MKFLEGFYAKVGDSIALGMKVRGIKGYLTSRDINAGVTAGQRMDTNLLASEALASGDEATIANIVTAETGVHPIKIEQEAQPAEISLSPDSIKALTVGTAQATATLVRNMLTPEPPRKKRRGRPPKKYFWVYGSS